MCVGRLICFQGVQYQADPNLCPPEGQAEVVLGLSALGLAADANEGRLMYRLVHPEDSQELPLRMLYHPVGDGIYLKACEADSMRGLVAALLDDPGYEAVDLASRLAERLRIANDVALLAELDGRHLEISDGDGRETIVIASDEPFIHSLQNAGLLKLADMRTGS